MLALRQGGGMSKASITDIAPVLQGSPEVSLESRLPELGAEIKAALSQKGAVLLRGFAAEGDNLAEQVLASIGRELLDDAFWSTPRTGVSKKTFTATEYASDRSISLHSEMSYMKAWPRLIAFHALEVADEGGETTVCDVDAVSEQLAPVIGRFAEQGVIYQRTYRPGVDIPWQKAFQTDDRDRVAEIAGKVGMQVEWLGKDVLRTRHAAQGTVAAEDGRPLWFNQTHIFHPANLPDASRASLEKLFGADQMPRSSYYGDGEIIEDEVVRRANTAFDETAIGIAWQKGDVVVLDNMRYAHGRSPFKGNRRLHVALANQHAAPRRTPAFN
jgi:alpha-ketoglutarate-dependent taurine dioxygenase